jgi:excisionase family DNA binding protein
LKYADARKEVVMSELSTGFEPQLLKPTEVANLLRVSRSTINNWIQEGSIPYIKLPGGSYRIPLRGLMASLSSNYDLGGTLSVISATARENGLDDATLVAMAGGDDVDDPDED